LCTTGSSKTICAEEEAGGQGYTFVSDTDTEVLCHLIRDYSEALPLEDAVRAALKEIKGAYAIAVVNEKDPYKIVGVRKDSPLS